MIFVEQGRIGCEPWYRASRSTVNRWLKQRGEKRLIDARAAYVAHQRAEGQWITRQTRMVEHKEVRAAGKRHAIRDKRKVHPTVARHAAQHLRIVRNGSFIVSPAGNDEWWVGSRRMSAAQMVELALSKGFNPDQATAEVQADPVERRGDYRMRNELIWRRELFKGGTMPRAYDPRLQPGDDDEVKS